MADRSPEIPFRLSEECSSLLDAVAEKFSVLPEIPDIPLPGDATLHDFDSLPLLLSDARYVWMYAWVCQSLFRSCLQRALLFATK